MRTSKQILYDYVSRARESCAGDSIKPKAVVVKLLEDAIRFATKCNAEDIAMKLLTIQTDMVMVKEYADRLPIDQRLCDILNHDLKG